VQKEVADRLLATPGGRDFGAISVLVGYHCVCERVMEVSRTVFFPRPEVDSTVLRFAFRDKSADDPETVKTMFRLVKAGFGMRRKTLRNSLASAGFSESALLRALEGCGIDPTRRAETLSAEDFFALATALRV